MIKLARVRTVDVESKVSELLKQRRDLEMEYFNMVQSITKGGNQSPSHYSKIRDKILKIDAALLEIQQAASATGKHYLVEESKSPEQDVVMEKPKPKRVKPDPKPKPVNKPPKVRLEKEEVEKILELNKNVLKRVFKFSNLEECNTSKRSKPYYMSKADIVKTIDENPDIKALVPKKYKSMKKEELCQTLFTPPHKN